MFRQKHTVRNASVIGLMLTLLTGCGTEITDSTAPSTAPTPENSDPRSLTLEQATTSYENFQRARDLVLADGGQWTERMDSSATGHALEEFMVDAQDFESRGWRLVGSTAFDSIAVQRSSATEISYYVCDDISGTDLIDKSGNSLVKPDRATRSPWSVSSSLSADGTLKVSVREFWVGDDFCD